MSCIIQSDFKSSGYRCVVLALDLGHRCGYVEIPKKHPLYRKYYCHVNNIKVHGGLTFSGQNYKVFNSRGWFLGFDCAHFRDGLDSSIMSEKYKKIYSKAPILLNKGCTIRTMEYVKNECILLAKQIKAYEATK